MCVQAIRVFCRPATLLHASRPAEQRGSAGLDDRAAGLQRRESAGAATGRQSNERPTAGLVVRVRGGRQILEQSVGCWQPLDLPTGERCRVISLTMSTLVTLFCILDLV